MDRKTTIYKGLILCLSFLSIISIPTSISQNSGGLSFVEESVNISIFEDSAYIIGVYWFKNNSIQKVYQIVYPFHTDQFMAPPQKLEVLIDKNSIPYKRVDKRAILFDINMSKNEQKKVTIQFKQDIRLKKKACKLTYITKSTRTWSKPLESAIFQIICDANFLVKNISMPNTKMQKNNYISAYEIFQKNFYPKNNLEIFLQKKGPK